MDVFFPFLQSSGFLWTGVAATRSFSVQEKRAVRNSRSRKVRPREPERLPVISMERREKLAAIRAAYGRAEEEAWGSSEPSVRGDVEPQGRVAKMNARLERRETGHAMVVVGSDATPATVLMESHSDPHNPSNAQMVRPRVPINPDLRGHVAVSMVRPVDSGEPSEAHSPTLVSDTSIPYSTVSTGSATVPTSTAPSSAAPVGPTITKPSMPLLDAAMSDAQSYTSHQSRSSLFMPSSRHVVPLGQHGEDSMDAANALARAANVARNAQTSVAAGLPPPQQQPTSFFGHIPTSGQRSSSPFFAATSQQDANSVTSYSKDIAALLESPHQTAMMQNDASSIGLPPAEEDLLPPSMASISPLRAGDKRPAVSEPMYGTAPKRRA